MLGSLKGQFKIVEMTFSDANVIALANCVIGVGLVHSLCARRTRSSADADNGLDAFSSQSRSTNMVPFWSPLRLFAKHVIGTTH